MRNVIELENVEKKYQEKIIFSKINVNLKNNVYFLKGKNGSGKSVFLRCLGNIESFSDGDVKKNNKNTLFLTDQSLCSNYLTILENIELFYSIHGLELTTSELDLIRMLYSDENQLNTLSENASVGMLLKASCTLLLKKEHWDLVILDETFSSIDKRGRAILLEKCHQLSLEGTCVIIVSHNELESEYKYNFFTIHLSKDGVTIEYKK
ncbi:ABC transporter ATP-binding protein [Enterococcus hirae]|uniref:ABC transporter ATP-binding protein n=1 Tax=Enterococcus hirae TaxID=1354 RepID=UPI001378B68C|nr:ABC transporter ATP-binding protein [Enterococcus hirae]NBA57066.1 ATPase [Enterococcus hirae]